VKRAVRTRLLRVVGAGGEKPPATRFGKSVFPDSVKDEDPAVFFICSVGAVYQQMKHCFSRIASEIPLRIATADRA